MRGLARRAADGRVYDAVGVASATSAPVWRRRGPLLSCAAYALLAGAQILFDELFPLYARGCLEWKPPRIGRFLALGGGSLLIGSFAAPHVLRLSSGNASRVFVVCNLLNVPLGVVVPALSSFAGLFPVYVSLRVTQTIAFCQVMLLVNTSAPMSELGAVNGLGQTLAAAMRALGTPRRRRVVVRALSLARDSGAAAETCPGVYAYLPYGARAFLVVAAIAAACALPTPTPAVDDVDDEERKDPDESVVFSPSSSEKDGLIIGLSFLIVFIVQFLFSLS